MCTLQFKDGQSQLERGQKKHSMFAVGRLARNDHDKVKNIIELKYKNKQIKKYL